MTNLDGRPRPLQAVAGRVGAWVGFLTGVLAGAAGFGVITVQTGDAVTGLLGLVPGLITAIGTLIAAFRTATKGEPLVTPVSDPRTDNGVPLVVVGR